MIPIGDNESSREGWYYRMNGEQLGPVSPMRLKELVVTGQLQPRQAVWRQSPHSLLFVPATTAVERGR
jgi:hypothetical protein